MNDTTVSNQAISNHATPNRTIPNRTVETGTPARRITTRSVVALLLGATAASLVAALGVGVLMGFGSGAVPGEPALDVLLIPLYAFLSLIYVLPLVAAFGVPYALLLLAWGRFRFWPMTLGGFAIAGGPAQISAAALHFGLSGGLVDVLGLLGSGAFILATVVPYPVAGFVVGLLGALGAAAFHRTYVWIARPR